MPIKENDVGKGPQERPILERALSLIRDALSNSSKPMVAFSGGKDSTVVLDLVRKIDASIPAYWSNTGVEYPDTVRFCRSIPNLTELHPKKTFWECIDQYGWPGSKDKASRHGNNCCLWLKEKPGDEFNKENGIDLVFTGITAAESRQRFLTLKRTGPYYYAKSYGNYRCHPIHDWTLEDVWQYIRENRLPYNPIYDRGARRCGCGPCTAYLDWKRQPSRENPKMLRMILKKQGQSILKFDCEGNIIG